MSGYCDFCQVVHSASCYHPGRALLLQAERELAEAMARLTAADEVRVLANEEIQSLRRELDEARALYGDALDDMHSLAEEADALRSLLEEVLPLVKAILCAAGWGDAGSRQTTTVDPTLPGRIVALLESGRCEGQKNTEEDGCGVQVQD